MVVARRMTARLTDARDIAIGVPVILFLALYATVLEDEMFKGWKTVAFGLLTAIVPAALTYAGGIDWTTTGISPGIAALIGAAIIALRAVTNTPMLKKE